MMSIQQAAILVGRQIGLPSSFDGSVESINELSDEDKISLTGGLGAYIRANPSEFTVQQASVANSMPTTFGQLNDTSFSIGDFLAATATNADDLILKPLVNVGQSASAVATWLPIIAIGIGAYLLFTWTRAKGAAIAA